MPNINLTQATYVDYIASLYLKSCNVVNAKFTPKYAPKTDKNPVPAILVHVEGVQPNTGILVNFDLWPRNDFDEKDLETFFTKDGDNYVPKGNLSDVHFRIGYYPVVNEVGQVTGFSEGKPKWIAYVSNGEVKTLGGEKREFAQTI